MEVAGSSETLVNIYKNAWCHIQKDSKLHSHHCEHVRAQYNTYLLWFDSKMNVQVVTCIYAKVKYS
jgi:hypothetical protein